MPKAPVAAADAVPPRLRGAIAWKSRGLQIVHCATGWMAVLMAGIVPAGAQGLVPAGDRLAQPLTEVPGDPARGTLVVRERERGNCLLCHRLPIREEPHFGDLGPDLTQVGARLDVAQLRLRVVDSSRVNPETVMPSYFRREGFKRVAPAYRDRTVLSAQEVEDVVAYLAGLR